MLIGVAGGTGSGKTTFTKKLKEYFGDAITVIYHDNYYRLQDKLSIEEREEINYDQPDQLETELLIKQLKELKYGNAVYGPVYDFTRHNRAEETILLTPSRVIVVEGLFVLYEEALRELFDLKIYVETDADARFARRVKRDVLKRGRDVEYVVKQYLDTVKPMHDRYVEPTKAYADIILNGGKNEQAFDLVKTKIQSVLDHENNKTIL